MNHIDKIYIIHYAPLTERKAYIDKKIKDLNLQNVEFFSEFDRNSTPDEVIKTYYKGDGLNAAQICITISHVEIYKKVLENNYKSVLILEDDALFEDNFIEVLNKYMESVPEDYDLLFLNDGCGLHSKNIVSDKIWYREYTSRTCCSYIVSNKCCNKLIPTIIPFEHSIDWQINHETSNKALIIYWCEPTIVRDGSGLTYSSSYSF